MSSEYHVISSDISIGKAEKIMLKKKVKLLAVQEENEFVGILSSHHLKYFRASLSKDGLYGPDESLRLRHHNVSEIMNRKLVRLKASDSIKMASDIMKSIIFQVIPVVEDQKLIGILTPQDIRRCQEMHNSLASFS